MHLHVFRKIAPTLQRYVFIIFSNQNKQKCVEHARGGAI